MDIQKYPSVIKDCDEGKTILGHYGPERPVNALPCIRSIIQKKELTDLMRLLKNSPVWFKEPLSVVFTETSPKCPGLVVMVWRGSSIDCPNKIYL